MTPSPGDGAPGCFDEPGLADDRSRRARVVFVSPEPTPYRSPLFDRIAASAEVELTVVYAARTVSSRTWEVTPLHDARFLDGVRLPGAGRMFRHDYPVTPGITRLLQQASPDCVVISGWSTFASQAALVWSRVHRVPYVLLVESHDRGPKPRWRRVIKQTLVPPVVRGAASVLVVGSLARESVLSLGAAPDRVRVFANTVDVPAFSDHAQRLAVQRGHLREKFGLHASDFVVVSVARLARDKGLDTLIRCAAQLRETGLVVLLAGDGPERDRLERLSRECGVRAMFAGERPWESVIEFYVAADAFALLSERETWGVVANEAAACGLPLVLSDRVGAAPDLLRDGVNGFVVPVGDVTAAAEALKALADDPTLRLRMGSSSREIALRHRYETSVDNLLTAVREATGLLANSSPDLPPSAESALR